MVFNSSHFFVFYPIVLLLYFATPQRRKWLILLVASYYFYASWEVTYLGLIIFSTLIDYFATTTMAKYPVGRQRLPFLVTSAVSNLGILFIFKYYGFFTSSFVDIMTALGIPVSVTLINVMLPVGISFYTFQAVSYAIDVYRGEIEAETHLGIFALYVAFFPQLVAGPIERAANLLPQFRAHHTFNWDNLAKGLELIIWGLFQKIVVADNLAGYVNQIYNEPHLYQGLPLILATLFFTFQIYCDFSGYSYIAIGVARIMGFQLMLNFRQPYLATSINDFWRRWHISLSTWFKDYVYIPLGGNRVSFNRHLINLAIVFLVSGLWHGAQWTFVIWGLVHAIFMVLFAIFSRRDNQTARPVAQQLFYWFLTFTAVVFAWIFFRANSVDDAFYIVRNLLNFTNNNWNHSVSVQTLRGSALIFLLFAAEFTYVHILHRKLTAVPQTVRLAGYTSLILVVLNVSAWQQIPFIYFQF